MARKSLRENLIASGVTTLHEHGFANAGVRQITAAAGVPQGTFTNHFRSKDAFGVAVLDRYFEHTEAVINATLRDLDRAPVDRLHAYFDAITSRLEAAGWRYGCMISNMSLEAAEHSDLLRGHLHGLFARLARPFADTIRAAQAAGEVRSDLDADDLADVVLSAWHGAMLRMKVDRCAAPLTRFRHVMLSVLLAPALTEKAGD